MTVESVLGEVAVSRGAPRCGVVRRSVERVWVDLI